MDKEPRENTELAHYRIVSKIGSGGMGEVYLAQDTKLDRKVAIKFLNEEFSKDADKLNRFTQEAKAVSALNHPNILTVYEIGETDDTNYIVTEFIEGKTLRERLSHKDPLQLNAILKIGVQVSEALSAAHQAGIIHRDIKPENIMIRKDGYAKVLDFGLAKLSEPPASAGGKNAESEDATRVQVNTTPGMVMGTVSYMSPEQARGNPTDARTDIWSLGVVLYEMLAGKVPFTGETVNHTIVTILEKEPLQLENVPGELQRIVRKSLTKDVDMRYQSARDILIDLKNLRRELDIQGELERSTVPNRDLTGTPTETATQMLSGIGESTISGQNAATQNVTTSSSSLEYAVTQAKSHKLVTLIALVLLIGALGSAGYFAFVRGSGSKQISSIAVMPFVNEGGNPDVEYLSDGMTETLISSLSQLPNLNVKGRSSVFRYKGRDLDAKTLGKELGVQAVLYGRVMQRNDQLTLSLELLDAVTENVIWSDKYDRKQSDVVTLQSEIARDVSKKLKTRLSGADAAKVEKGYTADPEAYKLYLQGRFYWNKRTAEDLKKSIGYFDQAIARDPGYALAYSGLGAVYQVIPGYTLDPSPKVAYPKAKTVSLKALEIDPTLAEPHATLAVALTEYEWKHPEAESEFKRAIELDPNYPSAHQWYGNFLLNMGRFQEAIAELKLAIELDPLSPVMNANLGRAYRADHRYDDAIAQYKKTLDLVPNFRMAQLNLNKTYLLKGMYEEAIEQFHQNMLSAGLQQAQVEKEIAELKDASRTSGAKGFWQKLLERQMEDAKASGSEPDPYELAGYQLGAGNKEQALDSLEKAVAVGPGIPSILSLKAEPVWDPLRAEPRFKELLRKVGLPE